MIRLQPIAEKVVYDLQTATGKDIELIDIYDRSIAFSSAHLHQRLEAWRTQRHHNQDEILLDNIEQDYAILIQGINLQEGLVGYIAIGGIREEIRILSPTVNWLAKLLIKQYSENTNQASLSSLRKSYFESLIFSSQSRQEIRLKASTANMDPEEPCYIAVFRLWYDVLEELDIQLYRTALNHLTVLLEDFCQKTPKATMLEASDHRILIADNAQLLYAVTSQIAGLIEKQCKGQFHVYGGISIRSIGHYNLRTCYENAFTICRCLANEKQNILFQENCLLELLMEQISTETKQEFVSQIFGNCPEEDVEEWSRIVHVLSQNNGSINRSATELFMHKNTLQYRLMRIKERIGLDARISQDALVLQIAFIARRSVNNDLKRRLDEKIF